MEVMKQRTRSASLYIQNGNQPFNHQDPYSSTCLRCGSTTSPRNSISISLQKMSTLNRSLAGTPRNGSAIGSTIDLGGPHGTSSLELEAIAAVHELSYAVQSMSVSEMLPRTSDMIFVNLTTMEGQPYCLELTHKGWRITSLRTDCMIGDFTRIELFTKYYDSPYELMDAISPGYRERFGEKLAQRLKMMENGDKYCVAPFGSYDSSYLNSRLYRSSRSSSQSDECSVSDKETPETSQLSEVDELDQETLFR
ncbi:hypothetical protein V3C99_015123 [Haemonchus contortus]